jgi:predicted dienelactone hydrolase
MHAMSGLGCFVLPLCGLSLCHLAAGAEATRSLRYTARSADQALAWQEDLRARLFGALKLTDLAPRSARPPCAVQVLSTSVPEGARHERREIEIAATAGRRIRALLTIPTGSAVPRPAVVCIHGHGGNRQSTYDTSSIYKGFAAVLADRGYVTIATDVGQHTVAETERSLMGERLLDLMRCVDYLEGLPEVDARRMGCAGLSLGGEMAMWLGAMDTRVRATVSSGFLTRMDQMEQNHCLCWKFPGLRELADFPDLYALTAPRALQCQNGLQEPASQFPVPLAREALAEIQPIYADMHCPADLEFVAHEGAHEIDLPSLLAFFDRHLQAE